MSDLIGFDNKSSGRMNSVQLVDIINEYRKKEDNDSILQHSHLLQKIEKELNGDEANFRSTYLDGSNRNSKCYLLPKDECILMLMSESRIVRKGVLNRLNELEKPKERTKIEIARSELALLEEKEIRDNLLLQANNKIEQDKHKVVFAESVIGSSNSILVRQFAKDLCDSGFETGEKRLYDWFRTNKYLNSDNEPYQNYVSMGLFEVITRSIGSGTDTFTSKTTKITGKGAVYFAKKIKNKE